VPTRQRPAKAPIQERVLNCIRLLVTTLAQSARSLERKSGMTNAQLFVLRELVRKDGQTINQLAARAMTQQSAMSLLVSRLEAAGYVKRAQSREDRRRIEVDITPAGRRVVRGAPDAPIELMLAALERLPLRDLRALHTGLDRLLTELDVRGDKAPFLFEPQD